MALRFDQNRLEILEMLLGFHEQGIPDAEIAKRLDVSLVTAGSWRRRLGIPTSDKFFYHFDRYYGEGAAYEFSKMLRNCATYARIGKHFGFSRQRALQIAQQHFPLEREIADEERVEKESSRSRGSAA